MTKRYTKIALICVCALMLALVPVKAGQVPSLYLNNEAWYRDAVSPLVVEDGICYIPAQMYSSFDYIEMKISEDENVLIYNRDTGGYCSVLLSSGKAAVNGVVVDTEAFRNGSTVYVDAMLVSEAVGLSVETYTYTDGTQTLRLADRVDVMSLETVVDASRKDDGETNDVSVSGDGFFAGSRKTIYILCDADSGENYSVCDTLEAYGLDFTCFVDKNAEDGDIFLAASHGEYGLTVSGAAADLDRTRERCEGLTFYPIRAVLDVGGTMGAELAERGYAAIVPDFTVDSGTYAMGAVKDVIDYLGDSDACFVYVRPSWNGQEFLRVIAGLDSFTFKTANISR